MSEKRHAKVRRKDGFIYYRIYQQDGSMQPMTCADTPANRHFVDWLQAHDRYTPGGPNE